MINEIARKPSQRENPLSAPRRTGTSLVDDVDLNSDESFPASDAPSWTPVSRVGSPRPRPETNEPRH
jgi:hypothetical protein